jgi:hypothetical protein
MQVYLPADLYDIVKECRLPASELLQEAVRREVHRRQLQAASEQYTAELAAEVGQATPQERAHAASLARRIARRTARKAG